MVFLKWFFLSTCSIVCLLACGPDVSKRDADTEENREIFKKQEAFFKNIEGRYEGTLRVIENGKPKNEKYQLTLRAYTQTVRNPGRIENTQIASIFGFLTEVERDNTNLFFTEGVFEESDSKLKLFANTGAGRISQQYLEVTVKDNRLVGFYMNNRFESPVDFKKVSSWPYFVPNDLALDPTESLE